MTGLRWYVILFTISVIAGFGFSLGSDLYVDWRDWSDTPATTVTKAECA